MTAQTNRELAGRAQVIADQSDRGTTRKAALCCAVALGTTNSVRAARSALEGGPVPGEVRSAALALLDELTAPTARPFSATAS
jgi:hypothetical protein